MVKFVSILFIRINRNHNKGIKVEPNYLDITKEFSQTFIKWFQALWDNPKSMDFPIQEMIPHIEETNQKLGYPVLSLNDEMGIEIKVSNIQICEIEIEDEEITVYFIDPDPDLDEEVDLFNNIFQGKDWSLFNLEKVVECVCQYYKSINYTK